MIDDSEMSDPAKRSRPTLPSGSKAIPTPARTILPSAAQVVAAARDTSLPSEGGAIAPAVSTETRQPPVAAVEDSRLVRIRRTTSAGGFQNGLPTEWGDEDGDWHTVRSDDPFEVLFLDYQQAATISVKTMETQHALLREFWKRKDEDMGRGAGSVRERIERTYGREVPRYVKRIDEAYRVLTASGGLEREAGKRNARRVLDGERELAKSVRGCLVDGALTTDETTMLFEVGEAAGLTLQETSEYLSRALEEGGFKPIAEPAQGALSRRLQSVTWLTPRASEAIRSTAVFKPLKFDKAAATSLTQLIDLCDSYRDEAEDYLFNGYLEPWLSESLNDASLARAARETRESKSTDRARGLEVFVRILCAHASRPSMPIVKPALNADAFGDMPMGAEATVRLALEREGRLYSWGRVACDPGLLGMVTPTAFYATQSSIDLRLDTTHVPPGQYTGHVVIEPEGGAPALCSVTYSVLPLTLTIDQPTIDFGSIAFGESRRKTFRIVATPPGGKLVGTVSLPTPQSGVCVEGSVYDAECTAEIRVETSELDAGHAYGALVRVETNAGCVDVPISFRVGIASSVVAVWVLGLAIAGAGVGGLVRFFISGMNPSLRGWYLSYGYATRDTSLALASGTVLFLCAAIGFWLRARARKGDPTHISE